MEFPKIEDGSLNNEISNAIGLIGTGNKAIQRVLIAILIHVDKNGEPSKANVLVKGMEDSDEVAATSIKAVKDYLEAFGKLTWDKEASVFAHDKVKKTKLNGNKEAKAIMWWSFKPKAAAKGFDFQAEVTKMTTKARKQLGRIKTLLAEGKSEEAATISVNAYTLQAIALINSGQVNAKELVQAFEADLVKAA